LRWKLRPRPYKNTLRSHLRSVGRRGYAELYGTDELQPIAAPAFGAAL
jgi:hypothetical protein